MTDQKDMADRVRLGKIDLFTPMSAYPAEGLMDLEHAVGLQGVVLAAKAGVLTDSAMQLGSPLVGWRRRAHRKRSHTGLKWKAPVFIVDAPQAHAEKNMSILWTDKYAPKNLAEVCGNAEALKTVRAWALDWARGKRQTPLLLSGPPGVGKTATAKALAAEMGWELLETNASDLRNADNLKKIAGAASGSGTLFGSRRLILLDEVDAAFDRGEVPELTRILSDALQPILVTANDVWEPKIAPLRALCTKVEFKKVGKVDVRKALQAVAEKEKMAVDVAPVVESAMGDLRAGLIDLQAGSFGFRERQVNVFDGVRRTFKAKNFQEAVTAQDASAVDFDLFSRWIEENVPVEYESPEDVAKAFDALSRAGVFSGRIRRRQNFALLKFVRALSLGGVAAAKAQPYFKFTPYQFPGIIRLLGQSRQNRGQAKSAWKKAANFLHCSTRKAQEDSFFYAGFGEAFGWNEDEASVVTRLEHFVPGHGHADRKKQPKKVRGKQKTVQLDEK